MSDVIRRINLIVHCPDGGDGFGLQRRATEWAQDQLLPDLARIIDAHPTAEDVVFIDRLDIELQSSDLNGWEGALLAEVHRQLPSFLSREVQHARAQRARHAPVRSTSGVFEALRYYLGHGRLPWYQASDSFDSEVKALLDDASPQALFAELLTLLASLDARKRLVRGLSSDALKRLSAEALAVPSARWSEWTADVRVLRSLFQTGLEGQEYPIAAFTVAPGHSLPEAFWLTLFEAIADTAAVADSGATLRAVNVYVRGCMAEARASGWKGLSAGVGVAETQAMFRSPEFREAIWQTEDTTENHRGMLPASFGRGASTATVPVSRDGAALTSEGCFITNAGTVLLGPYVRMYLERLGFAKDGRVVDSASALAALHFLVTGSEIPPAEHDLVLAKILCGLPLDEAPRVLPQVNAQIERETTGLLESIIEHWSVLKKTSVNGLREAFLQRHGKLSLTEEDTWLLQVEQKPYDMLLGQLPWSYRMLKLPWMDRLLITEWVD